jgi:hypothetical protein
MKKLLVMLGTFWMAGCSTTPARLSDTHVMPVTTVNRYANPTSTSGHVIVYRDPGIVGGACQPDIYLNGLDVADSLPAGGRVDFFPPAGEYIISAQTFCANTTVELPLSVKAGSTVIFEMGYRHGGLVLLPKS